MDAERKKLSPGMRRAVDHLKYDRLLENLEVLRCSNCLEPLPDDEPIYEKRSSSPDPDGESEITDHYCIRCVTLDPVRKKRPQYPPPTES